MRVWAAFGYNPEVGSVVDEMTITGVALRSWRERWLQVGLFELGGLLLITPAFRWATGEGWGESVGLLVLLSLIATIWQAVFNTVFDRCEARWARRPAHLRPWQWRAVHALGFEVTLFLITWPVIVLWTGWTWWAAAVADLGLALAYTVYAFLYHWLFDRWRPVAAERGA